MQIYNINKMKEQVSAELDNRIEEQNKNYLSKHEKYIQSNNTIIKDDIYHIENNSVNLFYVFESKVTNYKELKEKEHKKIIGARIEFAKFKNYTLKNIKFKRCTFYGTKFSECIFENIEFEECDFYEGYNIVVFNDTCIFKKVIFRNCNLKRSIFKESNFEKIKFLNSNLKDSIIANVHMKNTQINDCDCRMLKIVNPSIEKIKFEDQYNSKFDEHTFIDKISVNKNYKKSYENAAKAYRTIASQFEKNRLLDYAGEYNYLSKKTEHKALSGIDKIKSWSFWMLSGYGERPTYALITSIEIILLFAIMYMFTGLVANGSIINYTEEFLQGNMLPNDMYSDFLKSLYFSITTFTTVGYGDITPVGEMSTMLSGIEMFLGVTMVGIWTATLARKIIR